MYDATLDIGDIAEMLTNPLQNYAIAVTRGLIVIDEDPRNGGAESIERLQQEYGLFPATLTARTGGGGSHRWFAYGGPVRGQLAKGVDIKHEGGFVVVPPSVHVSGRRYEWVEVPDEGIAQAPRWLARLLAPPPPRAAPRVESGGAGPIDGLVRAVLGAQPGNRNSILYWAVRRAVESGHSDLAELAAAAHHAGLDPREVEGTVRSALRGAGSREQVAA